MFSQNFARFEAKKLRINLKNVVADHCGWLHIIVGHCEGKLLVVVTLCRWLWIVLDHCGLVAVVCSWVWVNVGRCGSLRVVAGRCGSLRVVVGRCGLLWVVVGRFGSFLILLCTSSQTCETSRYQNTITALLVYPFFKSLLEQISSSHKLPMLKVAFLSVVVFALLTRMINSTTNPDCLENSIVFLVRVQPLFSPQQRNTLMYLFIYLFFCRFIVLICHFSIHFFTLFNVMIYFIIHISR